MRRPLLVESSDSERRVPPHWEMHEKIVNEMEPERSLAH
jgi:hypothetical protein